MTIGTHGDIGLALLQEMAKKEGKAIPYYVVNPVEGIIKNFIDRTGRLTRDGDENGFSLDPTPGASRFINYWFAYAYQQKLKGGEKCKRR